jgi:hypothetical protein
MVGFGTFFYTQVRSGSKTLRKAWSKTKSFGTATLVWRCPWIMLSVSSYEKKKFKHAKAGRMTSKGPQGKVMNGTPIKLQLKGIVSQDNVCQLRTLEVTGSLCLNNSPRIRFTRIKQIQCSEKGGSRCKTAEAVFPFLPNSALKCIPRNLANRGRNRRGAWQTRGVYTADCHQENWRTAEGLFTQYFVILYGTFKYSSLMIHFWLQYCKEC